MEFLESRLRVETGFMIFENRFPEFLDLNSQGYIYIPLPIYPYPYPSIPGSQKRELPNPTLVVISVRQVFKTTSNPYQVSNSISWLL
jgi:hypothetical protein